MKRVRAGLAGPAGAVVCPACGPHDGRHRWWCTPAAAQAVLAAVAARDVATWDRTDRVMDVSPAMVCTCQTPPVRGHLTGCPRYRGVVSATVAMSVESRARWEGA